MIMIIATIVIAFSFTVFFYLFANIFIPLLFDIPATIKLGRKNILDYKIVLKRYINSTLAHVVVATIILTLTYYFFIKYSFGFSVSIFVGAGLAIAVSSWKTIWLFFSYSDNYSTWLDFYIKENMQYLNISEKDIIMEALNGKKKSI